MSNDLLDFFEGLCKKAGIYVEYQTAYPTCSLADSQAILINTNEVNEKYRGFALAHELGHIANEESGVFYYSASSNGTKSEHLADIYAVRLIYTYAKNHGLVFNSTQSFIESMAIPENVAGLVTDYIAKLIKSDKRNILDYA